ncbi:hypothetical protein F2Q70_00036080 [Brassica cretica]|uniref:Uncharacterized protein n=1 Tax=Brassica cretica TaxID=69181 RepID=A0A8S9JNP1_BRACR|nr:hypothetical protein F2Q70_00036080 [Brassica cretica]
MLCIDHIVNVEKKTVAAYELIGIYCKLIVRLSDVPELSEIVKQFTTKYGKDLLRLLLSFVQILVYVDMISNLKVAYVLRKRQAPDVMNEMSEV